MASLAGSKRPAEAASAAEGAEPVRKLTKTERRRERKQSPAEKIEYQYRIQVQNCAQQNDAARALQVYEQMKSEGVSVAPYIYNVVINVCSRAEDLAAFKPGAYSAYQDMKAACARAAQQQQKGKKQQTQVTEPIYSAMVKICSKAQDFEACETLIAEMEEAKVEPKLRTFGPLLQAHSDAGHLDKCVWVHGKFLEHELEPTEADYVALLRACVKAADAQRFYAFLDKFIDDIWQPSLSTWDVLKEWFSSEAARVDGRKWKISEGTVSKDGVCSITGDQLQSLELSPELTAELLAKIEKLVRTDEKRMAQWDEFKQWLEQHGPFDVVIDAANVGYCNQNFEGGGFNYRQIELMVRHYEAQGKKVLVVLHERRTWDEQVPAEHRAQIVQWRASGKMFNCQPGNNDDWYWLYAAVKLGGRTLMVSNDEMRDHHFQMIHNRAFGRWKERHQVHYQVHGSRVTVDEPRPYSARPQRVGDVWHFPASSASSESSEQSPGCTTETTQDAAAQVADSPWLCVALDA
ncbi:putative membrane protein, predicted efflux pump [Phytophthora cinnamomi]|uniref:putative membrane protein, predicted efflux pump n=1 Tax=Phytophthora cinnamomi TaxID=4785 RepID=UPI003559A51F|nr:putative membrane protein, predicted efflux pump [Phytophthora cinnamomi]